MSSEGTVDAAVLKQIDEAFAKLNGPEGARCNSLLKKHLTKETVEKLKNKKTKHGATLYDCIRSGVFNLDASIGVYAPDAESYAVFAELFDRIILDYHGYGAKDTQPSVDLGEDRTKELTPLDPNGKYVVSTRIRCCRSLDGFSFSPLLQSGDYEAMEAKVKKALESVQDEVIKGTYYLLAGMTKEIQQKLIADHSLFKEGDRHLQHANACKFWPKGRGIFHNDDKTFLVWVNEEDHLRLISMEQGSDVGNVLDRLIRGVKTIESSFSFSRDPHLGFLTFCPANLGSTIRASVQIKLPRISGLRHSVNYLKALCERNKLQIRESAGGIYYVSNKDCIGVTEFDAVKQMYDGVKHLIAAEDDLFNDEECEKFEVKIEESKSIQKE
uniref:Arginine kinase n=1 Tax=Panagrolaimus sp. ES5 TaxID=591445 RepID=A0AC34FTT1_9BILA